MLTTILAFIVVLGVLIFVHELGHFMTAKAVDIEVPRFSIGLGPVLWGFRRGETEYVISWLPLGGYVKMAGMEEMEQIEGGRSRREEESATAGAVSDAGLVGETEGRGPRTFEAKSLPARALVISAGAIMNLLFAVLVFSAISFVWGVEIVPDARVASIIEERLPPGTEALADIPPGTLVTAIGDRTVENWTDLGHAFLLARPGPTSIELQDAQPVTVDVPADEDERMEIFRSLAPEQEPIVGSVASGMPAAGAGLQVQDRIVAVSGEPVRTWMDLVAAIETNPGRPLELTVERGAQTFNVTAVPDSVTEADGRLVGRVGIGVPPMPRERLSAGAAIGHGFTETGRWATMIVELLGDLVTGDISPRQIGGPILISQASGDAARAGLETLLNFMGLLSVNLAILNLLPIPVLDGGHLLFLGVEAVRGRALSLQQRMRFMQVGLAIVVALMVWALASDLLRVFGL